MPYAGFIQFLVQMALLIVIMVEWVKEDLDGQAGFLVRTPFSQCSFHSLSVLPLVSCVRFALPLYDLNIILPASSLLDLN
jgi:hypothetical protein